MKEIWKDIPGYEKLYRINNYGDVFSLRNNRLLKSFLTWKGYLRIRLYKDKKCIAYFVHRLVLLTFVGNSKLPCNHKNGIKIDNYVENLEYCTTKENNHHARLSGLIDTHGERNGRAKLTDLQAIEIKEMYNTGNYSQSELARKYDISPRNMGKLLNGKTWKHIQI